MSSEGMGGNTFSRNMSNAMPATPNLLMKSVIQFSIKPALKAGEHSWDPRTACLVCLVERPNALDALAQNPALVFVVQELHLIPHDRESLVVSCVIF